MRDPRANAPRIILGWDPGPTKSGWAILLQQSGQTSFLDGGTMHATGLHVPFIALAIRADGLGVAERLCAIEAPGGYVFHQARGAQLLKTSHVAGELANETRHRNLQLVELSAQQWRRAFCGRPNATDAMVKQRCLMFVRDMPKRSSAHVRDAIGVAWASLMTRCAIRVSTI